MARSSKMRMRLVGEGHIPGDSGRTRRWGREDGEVVGALSRPSARRKVTGVPMPVATSNGRNIDAAVLAPTDLQGASESR